MNPPMATWRNPPRPRSEREPSDGSTTARIRFMSVLDLPAERRRRHWRKVKRALLIGGLLVLAVAIAVGLVLLCGRGSARR